MSKLNFFAAVAALAAIALIITLCCVLVPAPEPWGGSAGGVPIVSSMLESAPAR